MKRKLIGLGNGTLVVSLPSKYVQKNNLLKGDEITITDLDNKLEISSVDIKKEIKKAKVDVSKLSERAILWTLSAIYKLGYDEIEVIVDSPEKQKYIEMLTKDVFMGFMIVENNSSSLVIRQISVEKEEEFNIVLRRAFLVALSLAENTLKLIVGKKLNELTSMLSLEISNNQMTNFCQRIINKGLITIKPTFRYITAWNLEKVADEYKSICRLLIDKPDTEISDKNIKLFGKMNLFFRSFYELYFDFGYARLESLSSTKKELLAEADSQLASSKGDQALLVSYLKSVIISCSDFGTAFAAINQEY